MKKEFLTSDETRKKYIKLIETTKINSVNNKKSLTINLHYVDNPFLELIGDSDDYYDVSFYDGDILIHNTTLKCGMWTKVNRQYYTKWNVVVKNSSGVTVFNDIISLKNKKVYIAIDSKSLGDTIAWIPYLEEFRKKHDCELVTSTFYNYMFKEAYPSINFVEPGSVVHNLYAMYSLGWFYNMDKEPELPNTIPLQKTATNILGLKFIEIKPNISFNNKNVIYDKFNKPITDKYVTIATKSTAGLKLWNNQTGWLEVVKFLKDNGYRVINVSSEGCDIEGVEELNDYSIPNTINVINKSEFFIGLSSGLSWLSWAIGKHVIMISNFTEKDHEFTTNCSRIINETVCNGCWNNPKFTFDKGDWNWCPINKGTEKHFECHKSITGEMVINQIKKLLK
jgi:autotransporter strand-loop-strand O-heptosyltransferase